MISQGKKEWFPGLIWTTLMYNLLIINFFNLNTNTTMSPFFKDYYLVVESFLVLKKLSYTLLWCKKI